MAQTGVATKSQKVGSKRRRYEGGLTTRIAGAQRDLLRKRRGKLSCDNLFRKKKGRSKDGLCPDAAEW